MPGGFGVAVFFFLSGYLITSLLRKEHAQTGEISLYYFYRGRICRILPPLYCALAVTTVLDRFGIPSREVSAGGLLSVLFYYFNYAVLLFGRSRAHVANGMGILWSLIVEEHFYMLFPIAYLAMLRKKMSVRAQGRLLAVTCCAALLWRVVLVFVVHINLSSREIWTFSATDTRFDSILWGCLMAIAANPWCGDNSAFMSRNKARLAFAGAALLLFTFLVRDPRVRETARYTLQAIALFPLFYYLVAAPKSWLAKLLELPPLRWLGSVSYTMYLLHYFSLDVFEKLLPAHKTAGIILAFVAAALFSEGVRRFIEVPIRRWGHRRKFMAPASTLAISGSC